MTTFEWLSIIALLFGGFWKLSSDLSKIRETLVGKVGFGDCEHRRETCPLLDRIRELESRVNSQTTTQNIKIKEQKMKKTILTSLIIFTALALTSCATTSSTILEYDAAGNITKRTETTDSVIKEVSASTAKKSVFVFENGWAAYISASTATTQDPTPTLKMFAGKTDKGLISALPDQQNWDGIADSIRAMKSELAVTSDGITTSTSTESSK